MGSGEEQSCKFYLYPTVEERRGGTACSKPDFQSCGCRLISPSPSPYPGRRGTRGCGAQWFSPHPAASLPQAASGAALILLPLLASRCVRGGRRRRRGEEESGAARSGAERRTPGCRGRPGELRRREAPAPPAARTPAAAAATTARQQPAAAPARSGTVLELLPSSSFRSGFQWGGRCRGQGFILRGCRESRSPPVAHCLGVPITEVKWETLQLELIW